MKKLLFLFLLLIAGFSMAEISAQITEVTIGTGTGETYSAPIDNFYWHSWTETIYSADDYTTAGGTAGTITSLAFNVSSAASFAVTDIKIYLGTTSRTSHSSSSDWQAMKTSRWSIAEATSPSVRKPDGRPTCWTIRSNTTPTSTPVW